MCPKTMSDRIALLHTQTRHLANNSIHPDDVDDDNGKNAYRWTVQSTAVRAADVAALLFPPSERTALEDLRNRLLGDEQFLVPLRERLHGFWVRVIAQEKQLPHLTAVLKRFLQLLPGIFRPDDRLALLALTRKQEVSEQEK